MSADIVPFNKAATALPWKAAPVEDIIALFPHVMPDNAYDREAGGRVVELFRERCDLAAHYESFCELAGPRSRLPGEATQTNARFLNDMADTTIAALFTALNDAQDPLAFYCKNFAKYVRACATALDVWRLNGVDTPYTARSIARSAYDTAFPRLQDYDQFLFSV